jgi:hypothetical protein
MVLAATYSFHKTLGYAHRNRTALAFFGAVLVSIGLFYFARYADRHPLFAKDKSSQNPDPTNKDETKAQTTMPPLAVRSDEHDH